MKSHLDWSIFCGVESKGYEKVEGFGVMEADIDSLNAPLSEPRGRFAGQKGSIGIQDDRFARRDSYKNVFEGG